MGSQHPLGAKIWSSEKVDFGGYDFTAYVRKTLIENFGPLITSYWWTKVHPTFSHNAEGIAIKLLVRF